MAAVAASTVAAAVPLFYLADPTVAAMLLLLQVALSAPVRGDEHTTVIGRKLPTGVRVCKTCTSADGKSSSTSCYCGNTGTNDVSCPPGYAFSKSTSGSGGRKLKG